MKCIYCGNELRVDESFCGKCGHYIERIKPSQNESEQTVLRGNEETYQGVVQRGDNDTQKNAYRECVIGKNRLIKLSIIAAIIAVMVIGIVVCIKTQLFVDPVKSNPEGKYVVKTMDGKTVEETFKELAGDVDNDLILDILGIKSFDDFVTLELKTDGKVAFLALDEEPDEGTWKQDGDIVTITIDDEPAEFNFNGNELTGEFEEDGESHEYVFVKK